MKREWIKFAVLALLLSGGKLCAYEIAGGVVSGDARGIYLSSNQEHNTKSAQGFALNPLFDIRDDFWDFSLEAGGSAVISFSESPESFAGYNRFLNSEKEGTISGGDAWLTRLNLKFNNRTGFFKVGYQALDTPFINSGKDRLVPATFRALTYVNTETFWPLKMVVSIIDRMQSWDTGGETKMLGALFENDSLNNSGSASTTVSGQNEHAVNVFGLQYEFKEISAQAWYYTTIDRTQLVVSNNTYSDEKINIKPGSIVYGDIGLTSGDEYLDVILAYQYASMNFHVGGGSGFSASDDISTLNQRITGLKAEFKFTSGLYVYSAVNSVELETNMLLPRYQNGWGGYPEFAVADEYAFNRFDNRKFSAVKAAVGYQGADNKVGIAQTLYSGDKERGSDSSAQITDFVIEHKALSCVYETQEIYKSSATDKNIYSTLLKIQVTKQF